MSTENETNTNEGTSRDGEENLDVESHAEVGQKENPITAVAGQFGLDGQIFAAQLLNFVIVLVVLWWFAYRPILKLLDERQEKIEKSVKQADKIEARVKAIEEEREDIIKEAKRESTIIAEKAQKDGDVRREEIVAAAKREVERVIIKGKEQLQEEKAEMLRSVRKDIVDIAVKASARIVSDAVDETKSKSLASEVVRKMT